MKHGKHYVDAAKLVDSTKLYEVNEALELACKTASAKFDETVEVHIKLGLMPNPKAGTVAPDLGKAVSEAKAGKIEYRLDKQNIIHVPVGKASFGAEKLYSNLDTVMSAIAKAKPAAAKGTYFKSATIATTMGPGIRLNTLKYGV